MTERDIRGLFEKLPAPETNNEGVALMVMEEAMVLLVRIAEALEQIALNTMMDDKQ